MKRLTIWILASILAAASSAGAADIIYLKDGTQLQGAIQSAGDGWMVFRNGAATHVSADQVKAIELSSSTDQSPQQAAERLGSLRRSLDSITDPAKAIARYQRFLGQITDPAATALARKDLAVWQDRLDQHMVKFDNKWLLPQQRDQLRDHANAMADFSRQLLKQGRAKDADPILAEALEHDPENVSALYLMALVRFGQDHALEARKSLDLLSGLMPGHAPTLNNLAVVEWRQHQFLASIASYDAAMAASPLNKEILDNVVVALQDLPREYRDSKVAQKTARDFADQDERLGRLMAAQGWHRYGALWVTDDELQQIARQQQQAKSQLDQMSGQFDQLKARADQLSQQIRDAESQMHLIESTSYVRDPNSGAYLPVAYPPIYFNLQQDDQRERQELAQLTSQMDSMRQTARSLQDQPATQWTTHIQRMIGPEGTPLDLAQAPVAPPTSQPAADQAG